MKIGDLTKKQLSLFPARRVAFLSGAVVFYMRVACASNRTRIGSLLRRKLSNGKEVT
jgi:hypothetical protein